MRAAKPSRFLGFSRVSFFVPLLVLFLPWLQSAARSQTCVVIPQVPDASQPPASGRSDWCTPTAAVNIAEYWDSVMCDAGAFGVMNNWLLGVASDSIGWFMDTSNLGSSSRTNSGSAGTINQDIAPGFSEFARWDTSNIFGLAPPTASKVGYDWQLQTDYTVGFDFHAAEIDSGRPTIITFLFWNLVVTGVMETDPVSGETIEVFTWGASVPSPQDPGAPDETWNRESGSSGIGHAVTGIGYWRNFQPGTPMDGLPTTDWVIVHDNWSSTPMNIAVPWSNWSSVTKVKPEPFLADAPFSTSTPTVDGSIASGEYADADSLQFIRGTDTTKVYYKVDGTYFYAALHFTDVSTSSSARLYFDTLHDEGQAPQTDDFRLSHAINGNTTEDQGTGAGWSMNAPNGWTSAINVGSNEWQAEFRVSYSKLGILAGTADTLGVSFWDEGTANGDHHWPTGADDSVPCSWGDVLSSDFFVPVELTLFEATPLENNSVLLSWQTETETNNLGFEVQRKRLGGRFQNIAFVKGAGTTGQPRFYSFMDDHPLPGVSYYRLKQIDHDGAFEYSNQLEVVLSTPIRFALHQNYPNPFNAATKLTFELPEADHVIVRIYDITGREVKTVVDKRYQAGAHEVAWNGLTNSGKAAASGLYIYKIETGNRSAFRKLILLR